MRTKVSKQDGIGGKNFNNFENGTAICLYTFCFFIHFSILWDHRSISITASERLGLGIHRLSILGPIHKNEVAVI